MPRSTKQISQRYSGNLTYYLKRHYFRALRFRFVALVAIVSLLAMAGYGWWAWRSDNDVAFYSPGPISQAHASFANDCVKCHDPKAPNEERTIAQSSMDAACLKCHGAQGVVHQPDVARGKQSQEMLDAFHRTLAARLPLDDILVCEHTDEDECDCR